MVICLDRDADLYMAQQMPLPLTVSCFSKNQIGFTFLVPAYLGSPQQRAIKCVCVCVCLFLHLCELFMCLIEITYSSIGISVRSYVSPWYVVHGDNLLTLTFRRLTFYWFVFGLIDIRQQSL